MGLSWQLLGGADEVIAQPTPKHSTRSTTRTRARAADAQDEEVAEVPDEEEIGATDDYEAVERVEQSLSPNNELLEEDPKALEEEEAEAGPQGADEVEEVGSSCGFLKAS